MRLRFVKRWSWLVTMPLARLACLARNGFTVLSTKPSHGIPVKNAVAKAAGKASSVDNVIVYDGGLVMNELNSTSAGQVRMMNKLSSVTKIVLAAMVGISPGIINAQSTFTSFADSSGKHLFYVGNAPVMELSCGSNCSGSNWLQQDLSSAANLPGAGPYSNLTSYSDAPGEHLFFVDGSQGINYIHFAGNPLNTPLGVQSYDQGPTGFGYLGMEWLFYEASDQHVHLFKVSPDGSTKSDAVLPANTNGILTARWSPLASFSDSAGTHLFYLGTDHHVYQLWGSLKVVCAGRPPQCHVNVAWVNQDLTQWADPNGVFPLPIGIGLKAFSDATGEHAVYLGSDQRIYQLYFGSNGPWTIQTLSQVIGTDSPLASFADPYGEHVFYIAYDDHVHQLYFNGGWADQDLTQWAGALAVNACGGRQLTGFFDPSDGTESVYYVANDGNAHRLFTNSGGWNDQNLTGGFSFEFVPYDYCLQ